MPTNEPTWQDILTEKDRTIYQLEQHLAQMVKTNGELQERLNASREAVRLILEAGRK